VLAVEERLPTETRAILGRLGHRVTILPAIGAVSAVGLGRDGAVSAAGDRRKDGGEAINP
jgi:gamma-glutamyltranspeptidase